MADESSEEEERKREGPPPLEFVKPSEVEAPLPPRDQRPAAWVPRPEDYQPPPQWSPPRVAARGSPNLPRIAGIFLVLSGIVGMAGSIASAVTIPSVAQYANITQNTPYEVLAVSQICFLVAVWSQALALLGGVMAFQRMNWKLTMVCAIFALLTLGYFYFEASVLGLIGLVLTVMARPHFVS